ncbi:MAG: hypothetical protein PUE38_04470 [Olsenella sp.]|nr:hypothetical protein [Olsenella sp.]
MSQAATKVDATSQAAEPATSAASEAPAAPARDPMPRGMRIGESVFDIAYLLYDLVAGITFFSLAAGRTVFVLYGLLALVLGAGDAFHLVPRVQMHLFGVRDDTQARLGRGTQVASVTMTVFYVLLYLIWLQLFPGVGAPAAIGALIVASAAVRIVVCLLPQNDWTSGRENLRWSLLRNVPFVVTGALVIALFAISGDAGGLRMWRMCIAIALSFGFYLPVTFLAKRRPAVGALMLPKTLTYMWMIAMGLQLLPVL